MKIYSKYSYLSFRYLSFSSLSSRLSPFFPLTPIFLHRDFLQAICRITEATANYWASDLPSMVRSCAEARVEGRRAAVRDAPEVVRKELIAAEPLSMGLLSRTATNDILTSVPTVVNIHNPPPPR